MEGADQYIGDRSNGMMDLLTSNPNALTNAGMLKLIDGMPGHDAALWQVFKTLVADSDLSADVGLRLSAKSYIPKINEVLTHMRTEGVNMDWVTIQLKIALMADEKGAKGLASHSEDEYEWSVLGNTLPFMIQRGLRQLPNLYNSTTDFRNAI